MKTCEYIKRRYKKLRRKQERAFNNIEIYNKLERRIVFLIFAFQKHWRQQNDNIYG